MKATKNSIQEIGITTGLVVSLLLIAYFSLMKALGLAQIAELRYFNFFILWGGILYGYRHFQKPGKPIDYLPGIGLGFIITAASVFPFAAFLFVYFSYVDSGLFAVIKNSLLMGEYLTPFSVAGAIVIEGMSSGVIVSFVLMQYYKSGFERPERKRRTRNWTESYMNY